jgi:hypothetical protein
MPSDYVQKESAAVEDVEAGAQHDEKSRPRIASLLAVEPGVIYKPETEKNPAWYQRLLDAGVEENGIKPVPVEKRTNTRYNNLFTVFFTSLLVSGYRTAL